MPEHPHTHSHGSRETHRHAHGEVDPALVTTRRGIQAVKWSFLGLLATALVQAAVVVLSGSVALLADTIHNLGDATTAIPLWIAFILIRRKPSRRFTYGLGRVEDLAGVIIVLTILFSAVVAGFVSLHRLLHPQTVEHLGAVAVASLVGFLGNEAVAAFRIRVGREIGSAALVADGRHARVDALTSLAVLLGAAGVAMGYPLADPLIGLVITVVILRIVWESGQSVLTRLLDGVEPDVVDDILRTVRGTPGVRDVTEIRVRWIGHRLHAEINLAVDPSLTVEEGHRIAVGARQRLLQHSRHLSAATIHVDPADASGEAHHQIHGAEQEDLSALSQ